MNEENPESEWLTAEASRWAFDETVWNLLVTAPHNPQGLTVGSMAEYVARRYVHRARGLPSEHTDVSNVDFSGLTENEPLPGPEPTEPGAKPDDSGTVDLAKGDISPEDQKEIMDSLILAIARHYDIQPIDLMMGDRKRKLYKPRRVACYALRNYARMPFDDVARIIGGTSASAAYQSALRVRREDLPRDIELQRDLVRIRQAIPPEHRRYIADDDLFDPVVLEATEGEFTPGAIEPTEVEKPEGIPEVPIGDIIFEVCRQLEVTQEQLVAKRSRYENRPLQIAALLADELTDFSHEKIGAELGDRSAPGIKSLVNRAAQVIPDDPEWSGRFQAVKEALLIRHGIPVDGLDGDSSQNPLFDMLDEPGERDDIGPVEIAPGAPEAAELSVEPDGQSDADEEKPEVLIGDEPGEEDVAPEEVGDPEGTTDGTAAGGEKLAEEVTPLVDDEETDDEALGQETIELSTEGSRAQYTEEGIQETIKAVQEGEKGAENDLLSSLQPKFVGAVGGERLSGSKRNARLAELRSDALVAARRYDLRAKKPILEAIAEVRAERILRQERTQEGLQKLVPEPLPGETDIARDIQADSEAAERLLRHYDGMIDGITTLCVGKKLDAEVKQLLRTAAESQFLTAARYFHTSGNEHFGLWCAKSISVALHKEIEKPKVAEQLDAAEEEAIVEEPDETTSAVEEPPKTKPISTKAPVVLPKDRTEHLLPVGSLAVIVGNQEERVTRVRIKDPEKDNTIVTNLEILEQNIRANPHIICGTNSPVLIPLSVLARIREDDSFRKQWLEQCHNGYTPDSVRMIERNIDAALADPLLAA